jgi:hypothetical protein
VYVENGHAAVRVFPAPEAEESVDLIAVTGGLLIVADAQVLTGLRPIVEAADDDPVAALTSIMLAFARDWQAGIDDLAEETEALTQRAIGFVSGPLRTQTSDLRARLLRIQRLALGHQRLVERGGELAEVIPPQGQRFRNAIDNDFSAAAARTDQLYSVLGDALHTQSATVSERLTLLATVFLPLNVAVGFFGMNFGWMTDRIESATSFLLLGIGVPLLLVAAALMLARNVDVEPTGSRVEEEDGGSSSSPAARRGRVLRAPARVRRGAAESTTSGRR